MEGQISYQNDTYYPGNLKTCNDTLPKTEPRQEPTGISKENFQWRTSKWLSRPQLPSLKGLFTSQLDFQLFLRNSADKITKNLVWYRKSLSTVKFCARVYAAWLLIFELLKNVHLWWEIDFTGGGIRAICSVPSYGVIEGEEIGDGCVLIYIASL